MVKLTKGKMKIYQFRVSIIGIPRVYRVIEVTDNCTFDDLHDAIFNAFDRYDSHLYSFFITKEDTKNIQSIFNAPEITHPQNVGDIMGSGRKRKSTANTRIEDIDLNEKDVFHYLFDFGDDWWHRIRVQSIRTGGFKKKSIKIIKSVGKSPEQYPDYDDYENEDYD